MQTITVRRVPRNVASKKKRAIFDVLSQGDSEVSLDVARKPVPNFEQICNLPLGKQSITLKSGMFDYDQNPEAYMNFAHSDAFAYYGTELFAQDEIQTLEMPSLGSLRERLLSTPDRHMLSVGDGALVISGVPREFQVPQEYYAWAFTKTPQEELVASIPRSDGSKQTIVAIAAPTRAFGLSYKQEEIENIICRAFAAFSACLESGKASIGTGWWGCGAFGGNPNVMALCQFVAAAAAGIDLTFFAFDEDGTAKAKECLALFEGMRGLTIKQAADMITSMKYVWGMPNGT